MPAAIVPRGINLLSEQERRERLQKQEQESPWYIFSNISSISRASAEELALTNLFRSVSTKIPNL